MSGIYAIKVRLAGGLRFQFVTSRGGVARSRIYAGLYSNPETPTAKLAAIVEGNAEIVAAKVVDFKHGRDVPGAFIGEPTPPRPDLGGFRYLRTVADSRRGTFHILDPETGDYLDFDEAAYDVCVAEATRAGANPVSMQVYAKSATFSTDGVSFTQAEFAF